MAWELSRSLCPPDIHQMAWIRVSESQRRIHEPESKSANPNWSREEFQMTSCHSFAVRMNGNSLKKTSVASRWDSLLEWFPIHSRREFFEIMTWSIEIRRKGANVHLPDFKTCQTSCPKRAWMRWVCLKQHWHQAREGYIDWFLGEKRNPEWDFRVVACAFSVEESFRALVAFLLQNSGCLATLRLGYGNRKWDENNRLIGSPKLRETRIAKSRPRSTARSVRSHGNIYLCIANAA